MPKGTCPHVRSPDHLEKRLSELHLPQKCPYQGTLWYLGPNDQKVADTCVAIGCDNTDNTETRVLHNRGVMVMASEYLVGDGQ
jgi:hypothetical protein